MRMIIFVVLGALSAVGCASSQTNGQQASPEGEGETQPLQGPGMGGQGMMGGPMGQMCPMAVEGTAARFEEVEGGAAMIFTTTGDVVDLRRRVTAMAEMHNQRHSEGHMTGPSGAGRQEPGMGRGMGRGGMGMEGMMMPAATARVEEIEDGARLVFTPRDPADLQTLREQVGRHAQHMASGECPMMSGEGKVEKTQPSSPSEHEGHHPPGN